VAKRGRPRKHPPRISSVDSPLLRRQLENAVAYHLERCLAAQHSCSVSARIPLFGELLKLAFVILCEENNIRYGIVKPSKKPEKVIIYDTKELRKRVKIRSYRRLYSLAAHLADRALQAYKESRRLRTSPVELIAAATGKQAVNER